MEIIKLSTFLENEVSPFLLGAFFSRRVFTKDEKYIFIYTSYKKSSVVETKIIDFDSYENEYINILNSKSGNYPLWNTKQYFKTNYKISFGHATGQAYFVLENDLNITKESLYNKLYSKLLSTCDWLFDEDLNESKKDFIRGFMELRGSIDTKRDYISQDYFNDSKFEIRKARILIDYMNIPHYMTNINFRDLQHQYYTGIRKRNTQFRLKIWWYMENIGIMNAYKAEIFAKSRKVDMPQPIDGVYYFKNDEIIRTRTNINQLDDRLNFYFTNLIEEKPKKKDIMKMRAELGFDDAPKTVRSSSLADAIRYSEKDECVCCMNRYDVDIRTHKNHKTGRYYFEIHHVVSIGNNKELDDENNMVKLCPGCHSALRRGSCSKEEQKSMIRDIFTNAPKTLEFAKCFFDNTDYEEVVELTQRNLN